MEEFSAKKQPMGASAVITEYSKLIVLLACLPIYAADASQFEEVTKDTGIDYIGQSKGAAWADYNGDGWPDVWVTNRYNKFRLYVNNGDGTFTDSSSMITSSRNGAYGAAWGDFDNDGDPDIMNAGPGGCGGECGGVTSNTFLVNDNGFLVDQASSYGVDYPRGRGRTPLWFDWNLDGYLDLLVANLARPDGLAPTAIFTQDKDGFLDDTEMAVISSKSSNLAQLASFAPGSPPSLVLAGGYGQYPLGIYDYSALPFLDIRESLGLPVTGGFSVQDAIIADFNGDLLADVFVAQAYQAPSGAVLIDDRLAAQLVVMSDQKVFRFKAKGNVRFEITGSGLTPSELFIGENGTIDPDELQFTLSDDDPAVRGIQPHEPGADTGIYIGYQATDGFWEVQLSSPKWTLRGFQVEADSPISELITMGFGNSDGARTDRLFLQTTNGFQDTTAVAGLDTPTPCGSAVSADFDNDMDLDIYLVCRGAVNNRANILYENLGDGIFQSVIQAGGAEGSGLGRGDSVATADFDLDGFMDFIVTNGDEGGPFNKGPHQVFRNLGNSNHWLEIDLEGTRSNRDGIGAQVLATAAGVTQLRDQSGGVHLYSQNHQRIHFGLGHNTVVDRIAVHWPNGIVQNIHNIPADQIIRVAEPSTPSIFGKPRYSPGVDIGVYVWKDVADEELYHLRVSGDGPLSEFKISIIAGTSFGGVTPYALEGDDIFEWTGNYINLTSRVTTWEDGVDFSLPLNFNAIISVEQDGEPNPRQLHIGASGAPLSPSGWIVDIDSLPEPPTFQAGEDLGLFLGRDTLTGSVILRCNGDGNIHIMDLALLSSQPLGDTVPVAFEQDQDFLYKSSYTMFARSKFSTSWDGIDVMAKPASKLGLTYSQDGLFPSHLVNPITQDFGLPNAYWLPATSAFGRPSYDPGSEQEIYFWKANSGVWRVRATAGGDYARYTGTITADVPAIHVNPVMLEFHDMLDSSDLGQINFDIQMWKHWEDGIDIQFPEGTRLCVAIETPGDKPIMVGPQRIPVPSPFDPLSLGPCDPSIR